MMQGLAGMTYEEGLRIPGLPSLRKMRPRGNIIAVYDFFMRGEGERGAGLFSLASSDWIQGNGLKLCQGKFRSDTREKFFTKRVLKHWNKLLWEVVTAPSLWVLNKHLDNALS